MRIFVAGATGVIGRRTVPLLIAAGHQVTAIGRTAEKRADLARLGATALDVDLFNPGELRRAVAGHEVVINLATHLPAGWRMFAPRAFEENDRIRRVGAANLVYAGIAAGARRFIQESFAPVYPDSGERWIDETVPIAPVSYNRSVADAERSAERFSSGDRTGVVLRFAAFYGPDAWQTRQMIDAVRRGFAPWPGAADAFISSVSHDDAATAVVTALGVRAGAYNVADDEPQRRRDYFDALAAALGVAPPRIPPRFVARLFGSLGEMLARSLRLSNRKLRACGWAPRFASVRDGWPAVVRAIGTPTVAGRVLQSADRGPKLGGDSS
jgi:nucleoside-diphosphate-sugar epimerase